MKEKGGEFFSRYSNTDLRYIGGLRLKAGGVGSPVGWILGSLGNAP
jgi:hypothetical protein